MKKILLFIIPIIILSFSACKDTDCMEDNEDLKLQLEEYSKREKLFNEVMVEYDNSIDEYKKREDTLKMFQDSVKFLTASMNKKGYANRKDSEAIKKYMAQINKFLSENKQIAENLKEYVGDKNLGKNPALVIEFLAQNIAAKEKEIEHIQKEIETLKNKVKGLEYEVVEANTSKTQLENKNATLESENEKYKRIASKLRINKIGTKFYTKKNSEIDKSLSSLILSKRLRYIEFCLTIPQNNLAHKGEHVFYIQIIKNNQVYTTNRLNLFQAPNSKMIGYSLKHTINYNGTPKQQCVKWDKKDINLKKGEYEISVLNSNAEVIGTEYFSL